VIDAMGRSPQRDSIMREGQDSISAGSILH
jgi:hypothetical protein